MLEDFLIVEVGYIFDIFVGDVEVLVVVVMVEIEEELIIDVLIIEDQLLILMQLEWVVSDFGYCVIGIVVIYLQVVELFICQFVGFVFVDIQFVDGSLGIDVVQELLELGDVLVIFIIVYFEKLFIGECLEFMYLIIKLFQEFLVCVVISQVLFFGLSSLL